MRRLAPTLVLGLVLAAGVAGAQPPDARRRGLSFGPAPEWVDPMGVGLRPSPDATEISGGIHYLLIDQQTRVGPRGEERFGHFARRIVTEAGLESASQVSLSYDPGYESLTLHYVRLRRGGAVLDRLSRARVELVQRETELEAQVYDGALSALVFVEDLRVGDVIEYAYTLRGANPVLEGRFTDGFDVEWSVPVRHWRFRLLWPPHRTLRVRGHGTSIAPVVEERPSGREYVWELEEVAPVESPGPVPSWFPSWAWVQLSEFESWADVADWSRRLYVVPGRLPPELARLVGQWAQLPDESERARAALRFVQDEVRYLGIEMGTGSHRPSPPEVVLSRRFGDCKDKSLLLTTLLEALGVRARPALVHTTRGRALDDWLPTPYAFNHVVTRAEVGGRVVWLDPTRGAQGGTLEHTYFPDLERALVVDAGTEGLTEIPAPVPDAPTEVVREDYRIGDAETPVEFTVETRFEGPHADRIRDDLRRRSREEIGRGYVDYYKRSWPDIRSLAPLDVEDDREKNVVVVRERYAIPGFWQDGSVPGRREAGLWASTFGDYLRRPDLASHAPLAVPYPVFIRHETRVHLPGDWGLEPDAATLDTPAVHFSFAVRPAGDALELDYELRTLADTVPAPAVADHLARLDEMWNRLEYTLARPAGGHLGGTNWIAVLILVLAIALAGMGGAAILHFAPPPGPAAPSRGAAARGAAIVLGALVAGAAVVHGLGLLQAWRLCRPAAWDQRTLPGGTLHHPLWAAYLLSQLAACALLLALALALLVLLVRGRARRRVFVSWAFVQTALLFASAAVLAALPGAAGSGLPHAVRDALLSLLPLLPGTAIALWRGRPPLTAAGASSSRP